MKRQQCRPYIDHFIEPGPSPFSGARKKENDRFGRNSKDIFEVRTSRLDGQGATPPRVQQALTEISQESNLHPAEPLAEPPPPRHPPTRRLLLGSGVEFQQYLAQTNPQRYRKLGRGWSFLRLLLESHVCALYMQDLRCRGGLEGRRGGTWVRMAHLDSSKCPTWISFGIAVESVPKSVPSRKCGAY